MHFKETLSKQMASNAVITANQSCRRGCMEPGADGQAVGTFLSSPCEVRGNPIPTLLLVLGRSAENKHRKEGFQFHSFIHSVLRSQLILGHHMSTWVSSVYSHHLSDGSVLTGAAFAVPHVNCEGCPINRVEHRLLSEHSGKYRNINMSGSCPQEIYKLEGVTQSLKEKTHG